MFGITTFGSYDTVRMFEPAFEVHANVRAAVPNAPQSVQLRLTPPAIAVEAAKARSTPEMRRVFFMFCLQGTKLFEGDT
jgi:hypothetical protein